MQRRPTRAVVLAVGLVSAVAIVSAAPWAAGQTGPGWVSLFDGKAIGDEWSRVGETNWRVEDGAIVADNGPAWMLAGAPDERWDNGDLLSLHRVPGSAFEAVDTSSIANPGSLAVR